MEKFRAIIDFINTILFSQDMEAFYCQSHYGVFLGQPMILSINITAYC